MSFKPPWVWIREDWEAKQRRFEEERGKPRSRLLIWMNRLALALVAGVVLVFALLIAGIFYLTFLDHPMPREPEPMPRRELTPPARPLAPGLLSTSLHPPRQAADNPMRRSGSATWAVPRTVTS